MKYPGYARTGVYHEARITQFDLREQISIWILRSYPLVMRLFLFAQIRGYIVLLIASEDIISSAAKY